MANLIQLLSYIKGDITFDRSIMSHLPSRNCVILVAGRVFPSFIHDSFHDFPLLRLLLLAFFESDFPSVIFILSTTNQASKIVFKIIITCQN